MGKMSSNQLNNESQILEKLKNTDILTLEDTDDLYGTLISLQSREIVKFSIISKNLYRLTDEGAEILEKGSPEYNLYTSLTEDTKPSKSLAFLNAMKKKYIKIENGVVKKNKQVASMIQKIN